MLRSSRTTLKCFSLSAASASQPLLACVMAMSHPGGNDRMTMLRDTAESSTIRTDVVISSLANPLAMPGDSAARPGSRDLAISRVSNPEVRRAIAAEHLERIVEVQRGLGGAEQEIATRAQHAAHPGQDLPLGV